MTVDKKNKNYQQTNIKEQILRVIIIITKLNLQTISSLFTRLFIIIITFISQFHRFHIYNNAILYR